MLGEGPTRWVVQGHAIEPNHARRFAPRGGRPVAPTASAARRYPGPSMPIHTDEVICRHGRDRSGDRECWRQRATWRGGVPAVAGPGARPVRHPHAGRHRRSGPAMFTELALAGRLVGARWPQAVGDPTPANPAGRGAPAVASRRPDQVEALVQPRRRRPRGRHPRLIEVGRWQLDGRRIVDTDPGSTVLEQQRITSCWPAPAAGRPDDTMLVLLVGGCRRCRPAGTPAQPEAGQAWLLPQLATSGRGGDAVLNSMRGLDHRDPAGESDPVAVALNAHRRAGGRDEIGSGVRITVLAGGVGGARFLQGVRRFASSDGRSDEITAIVNTGDDVTMHGLRICPDLDSVMYTLAGAADAERGWGRDGESWRIRRSWRPTGPSPTWFGLGDLDIATHLVRTQMLDAGYPLSDVTAALCQRWQTGVRLLPMTDQRCETHVVVTAGRQPASDPLSGMVGSPPGRPAGTGLRPGRAGFGRASRRGANRPSARPS